MNEHSKAPLFGPLIDAPALSQWLARKNAPASVPAPLILDCRHDLFDAQAGRKAFEAGHIEGARFFNMETDASGPHTGKNGRHPLPTREEVRARLAALGLSDDRMLVAYDAQGGQFASRVWWMARWIGHARVAVLDGGWPAWQAINGAVQKSTAHEPTAASAPLGLYPSLVAWVNADQVQAALAATVGAVIDARAPERYRGESEPLDPVAGHITGAANRFYQINLNAEGHFKPAQQLREEWLAALPRGFRASEIIHHCGSGVTACHNVLSMESAGFSGSALYPGSWSEWCSDPKRPMTRKE